MKKNITSLLVCFAIVLTTLGATNPVVHNPIKKNFLIESNELNVSLVASSNQDMFINASYNNLTGTLNFKTVDEISFIQIFKENELQFQLPVMSDIVKISKSLFESGVYKLGFMIEGSSQIQYTEVEMN